MDLLTAPLPGLYLGLLAFLLDRALRRWWDPVPARIWGAFALVLAILFGSSLFLGTVLLSVDIVPGVRTVEKLKLRSVGNSLQLDIPTQILPTMAQVRRQVKSGAWPMWNDLAGAGMPLLGDPQSQSLQPLVLATLPRREFRAGLYEVIKYGMTTSRLLFDRVAGERKAIFARAPEALTAIIAESCRIKASVVADDEREAGPRRILNFGHTAAHAIEAVTKYRRFRHGEAVGYGMLVAAELARARGALADRDRQALADLVASLGPLPPINDLSATQMLEAMQHDKKVVAGKLHFVLPTAIGAATIVDDVTEKELRAALRQVGFAK